ncbi:MAG TPA: hypothetical protein VGN93_29200 [Shinella sp.]|uniref:hypothetical protein n=1 Tax=Shinella sp. TaxID=1870904 RepID=UPI002E121C95|nr:hypothetical protein [Shinella sp.]
MRVLPVLAAAGLMVMSAAARAQEPAACPAKAAILALSDTVLAGRETLPRLKARGFGAEAAYLKIRYGGLSAEDATTLAHGLRDVGVREAIDLAGALDARRGGFDAVAVGPAGLPQFGVLISTVRAVLEQGDTEKLLAAIAALKADQQASIGQRIVAAVIDWPDERKAALAEAAGKHGLLLLQAGLIASQRDPKAWATFAASKPDRFADLVQAWNWAPGFVGNPALPRPAQDAKAEAMRKSVHTVFIVAAREPERDFLMTYLNYTGDIADTEKAAQAVLAEIDAGRIRSEGLLDPAWLTAYRSLRATAADPAKVDTVLAEISFYAGRYLRTADGLSVRDVIDRLVAVEALTPFLKGEATAVPEMPEELSAKFQAQWPLWTEMAAALKAAPLTPLAKDPLEAPILAELLFAAGDHARLADVVLAAEPVEAKLAMATDFAMRLDRGCASFMYHQAEAVLLSGQPIFKFDTLK